MKRIAKRSITHLLVAGILALPCRAFLNVNKNLPHPGPRDGYSACYASRREILSTIVPATLASAVAMAPNEPSLALSDSDLTEQMFNADGSLKEGYESVVTFRDVSFVWDQSDAFAMNTDGTNVQGTTNGTQYTLSYQYPMRWSDGNDGDPIYFDRTEGINRKATKGIIIYQAPGKATVDRVEKATTVGIAKSLDVPKELSRLYKADVISGRTVERGDQKFYEFDMASAPETCGNSKENLGLGFCPYDDLFLLSATIVNDRLYCMVVECDSTKVWKLESKELKRIRSTFTIEEVGKTSSIDYVYKQ